MALDATHSNQLDSFVENVPRNAGQINNQPDISSQMPQSSDQSMLGVLYDQQQGNSISIAGVDLQADTNFEIVNMVASTVMSGSRKRRHDETQWKKNKSKAARQAEHEYVNSSGENNPAKVPVLSVTMCS